MGNDTANERRSDRTSWRRPGPMSARFGGAIEQLKDARGLEWTAIGKQLGQSESTLHRIKRGDVSVSWEMLEAFAEVFDCPVETLLVLAGAVSVELADDELSAVVAGVLEVPLQVQATSIEAAIDADETLTDAGRALLSTVLAAERRKRR